jgi:ABC-type uncharacterized transport system permease subunit
MRPAGVNQPGVNQPGEGERPAHTGLVDCLLATICAYFFWSGLFHTISGQLISMLAHLIEVGRYFGASDGDENLFVSALTSAAAAVKSGLEKVQYVDFDEGDHGMVYEQTLRFLKKIRERDVL